MASDKRKRQRTRAGVERRRQPGGAPGRGKDVVTPAQRAERMRVAFRRHRRNRIIGWTCLGLGLVVFGVHWFDHLQTLHLYSQSVEELTIGWPTAAVLVVAGIVFLGQLGPGDQR